MRNPSLGVIMIVKNEEDNLPGILSDIRGIADEICIVDTGSTDGTLGVAESSGAKIGHFPWINDFAAARNHSIAMAQSDYLLWLDADDRIDEPQRAALLDFKTQLRPEKDRAYNLKIFNTGKDGADALSYQIRIIPNLDTVRFEGRIHEQVLPALHKCGVSVQPAEIVIRHTGYHDPEARPAKARRNIEILLEELRDGKDTASQHFFIALTYFTLRDFESSYAHFVKAREKHTDEDWLYQGIAMETECLLRLQRVDDALDTIQKCRALYPDSSLLHYCHGEINMQLGRYGEAVQSLEMAALLPPPPIESWPTHKDLGTKIQLLYGRALGKTGRLSDAMDVFKRALQTGKLPGELNYELGIGLAQLGRVNEAVQYLEQARALSAELDKTLWLTLASIYCFFGRHGDAHVLYGEVFGKDKTDTDCVSGLIRCSVAVDDVDGLLAGLESLMNSLSMDTNRELNSPAEIAALCAEVGKELYHKDQEKRPHAMRLAEAALLIDPANVDAHLLLSDVYIAQHNHVEAIKHLEQATQAGASLAGIESRMTRISEIQNRES